ncbi:winged helix-turn-helix transcriptional regulator [Paenibacillus oceani]|uniref:Helix-turn-helix transcriptional regulator n=1 Tax=Paenibacillus oceani TaxID=2772510 RepID=A0A927H0M4_9BACL|nr:helix-turn-helix domain-containing protein [Paenibacillus oceani]MBD2863840.1 helix-turn-helix transcriptional regulator [Paenibacillus oceani]
MQVCPYLEYAFSILGKKWNGLILHDLSLCPDGAAHFSEILKDLPDITPRALSLKLTELAENGFLEKQVTAEPAVVITYRLTEKGRALTAALGPVQQWALQYRDR